MKKMSLRVFVAFILIVLSTGSALAASSMVVLSVQPIPTSEAKLLYIKITCSAETDGTFTNETFDATDFGYNYTRAGYALIDAWAVNGAATYPTSAGTVTLADTSARQLVGATAGDTLTVSTSASGVAQLLVERGSGQRRIVDRMVISIGNIGASKIFTLHMLFQKP